MKSRVQRARRDLKELLEGCCVVELDRRGAVSDYQHKGGACGCRANDN
jgi:RNA polymerase sigma-70 factor, ECF subfamily